MAKKRKKSGKQARRSRGEATPRQSAGEATPAPPAASRSRAVRGTPPARAGAAAGAHRLDLLLLVLAGAGILLTAYLTGVNWFGESPAFCGAGSSCDLVQSSRWSTLLGLPMALWGLLTYAVLFRVLWKLKSKPSAWRTALAVAAVGAAVSWYLTIVSVVQIEATCAWCMVSFVLMNLILVVLLVRRPAHLPEHAWSRSWPTPAALAGAVVLGLYLNFSGLLDPAQGPEDPYLRDLATHLSDSGARFYGAYWCPHCQDQKELFTASVDRLPYVECSPEGRGGPVNIACLNASIRDYPTWVINDQRYGGVMTPERLARISGFRERGAAQ